MEQASRNAPDYLGVGFEALLGRPLAELFDPSSAERVAEACNLPARMRELNPLRLRTRSQLAVDAVLHINSDLRLIVELERLSEVTGSGFDPRLRGAVMRMQTGGSVDELCSLAVEQFRLITGFDRVMVYRFDRDWNGEVIAEARREDLEPFLGLHYPASDIPAQARRLYTINWLRFIADAAYVPVPIEPALALPLDMSHAALRSVSPIHIEYLHNMGVKAAAEFPNAGVV